MTDWVEAYFRRFEPGFSTQHPMTLDVLSFHALIEQLLDEFIERALPYPARLHGLGFGQKVGLWGALVNHVDDEIGPLVTALARFNDIRNSVAHGDPISAIDKQISRLIRDLPSLAGRVGCLEETAVFLLGTIAQTTDELR